MREGEREEEVKGEGEGERKREGKGEMGGWVTMCPMITL